MNRPRLRGLLEAMRETDHRGAPAIAGLEMLPRPVAPNQPLFPLNLPHSYLSSPRTEDVLPPLPGGVL